MSNPELNNLLRRRNELTSKSHTLTLQLIKAIEEHTDTTRYQLNNIVDSIDELKDELSKN